MKVIMFIELTREMLVTLKMITVKMRLQDTLVLINTQLTALIVSVSKVSSNSVIMDSALVLVLMSMHLI